MKSKLLIFIALFVLICSNCKREGELQGTVFIVTKGAENYKLGLVKVSAIPEDKIQQFVNNKKSAITAQYNSLKAFQGASKGNFSKAQKYYDDAKKVFDSITEEKSKLDSVERDLNSKFSPSSLEVDEYLKEFETPEDRVERAKQRQIQKQLQSVKQHIAKYEPILEDARRKKDFAEKQFSDLKSQETANQQKVLALLNEEALFEGVPEGDIKAVTDADGKFSLKLPNSGKYALIAHSQRRVFDSTEEYYWIVWASLDGQNSKQIMLTNQNVLGEDSEDSVFKTKDLIPEPVKDSDKAIL